MLLCSAQPENLATKKQVKSYLIEEIHDYHHPDSFYLVIPPHYWRLGLAVSGVLGQQPEFAGVGRFAAGPSEPLMSDQVKSAQAEEDRVSMLFYVITGLSKDIF